MNHGAKLDFYVPQKGRCSGGLTLLELLLVMAMVGILVSVSTWGGRQMVRGWPLKRAGHQLLEDLEAVQARAEMSSCLSVSNGALVIQRTFLVFDPTAQSYAAYVWQDRNGDNAAEAGECDQLWRSIPATQPKATPGGKFFRQS